MKTGKAHGTILAAVFVLLSFAAAGEVPQDSGPPEVVQDFPDVTPSSIAAARRGLDYLAAHQNPDGSWDGDVGFKLNERFEVIEHRRPHVGVTALAGIAFLSGGHLPERGAYAENISRSIDFVLSSIRDTGYITSNGTRMYSHAFAALFLAEVYGMTHRADVGRKLQMIVDLIVECQNRYGSWRYEPFAPESDMSITVCQLMALRAARNIGIKVPRSTIDRAVNYVRQSYVGRNHRLLRGINSLRLRYEPYYNIEEGSFLYQNFPDEASGSYRSSFSLTAAGVVSLFHAGHYSEAEIEKSLDYLMRNNEIVSTRWRHHYFYWYGHYYAVQAAYIAGGRFWDDYYTRIRRDLVESQRSKGYWTNPVGPGENFATAVAVIVLQIPLNYLPIFQR